MRQIQIYKYGFYESTNTNNKCWIKLHILSVSNKSTLYIQFNTTANTDAR